MKWMKNWNETKWNDMKWNEMNEQHDITLNETTWHEWNECTHEMTWKEWN